MTPANEIYHIIYREQLDQFLVEKKSKNFNTLTGIYSKDLKDTSISTYIHAQRKYNCMCAMELEETSLITLQPLLIIMLATIIRVVINWFFSSNK